MKKECKVCGARLSKSSYGPHMSVHARRGEYTTEGAKPNNKKKEKRTATEIHPASSLDILLELENQTKQAVKNLQMARTSLAQQTEKIDEVLKRYSDSTHH